MKIIFILLLIFSIQITFGQEKQNTCSDCKTLAQPIFVPKPEYPKKAEDSGIKGTVKVQVSIDEKGNVTEAKLIEGNKVFEENAIKAAVLAKFKPAKYTGTERVGKSFGVLVFNFVRDEEDDNKDLVLSSPINLPKPPLFSCNCKFGTKTPQVLVQIEINESGEVFSSKAVLGHPALRNACETAARNSKFSPAKFNGIPIRSKANLLYEFNLDDDSKKVEVQSIEAVPQERSKIFSIHRTYYNHAVSMIKPKYPEAAKYVKASGAVGVEIVIDENGNVESAQAVSGHPLLRAEAVKAALDTKFPPTYLNGKAVKVRDYIVYTFVP